MEFAIMQTPCQSLRLNVPFHDHEGQEDILRRSGLEHTTHLIVGTLHRGVHRERGAIGTGNSVDRHMNLCWN